MVDSYCAMDIQGDDNSAGAGQEPWLTKTLVPSPIIKDIFEANMRTYESQDIIFIKVSLPASSNSANIQDHVIELYSLNSTSLVLESSLPMSSRIRCAVPYVLTRPVYNLDYVLSKQSSKHKEPQSRDSILLVTDSTHLVVVDWDTGGARTDGGPIFKSGLRQRIALQLDYRPGGTPTSLGKIHQSQ